VRRMMREKGAVPTAPPPSAYLGSHCTADVTSFLVTSRGTCNLPPASCSLGALAQLGEHLLCKQGVAGSIPARSIWHS
jgi:hypothetical protein